MIKYIFGIFLISLFSFHNIGTNKAIGDAGNYKGKDDAAKSKKKIIFIAGKCSHNAGQHEGNAGCILLADALNKSMPNVFETVVYQATWPTDKKAFDNVAAIVMYVDGASRHPLIPHLQQVDSLMKKGVGLVSIHFSIEVPKGDTGNYFLNWLGGYFEVNWSINPYWNAEFRELPRHPVTNGVKPFTIRDEWYYHMRFRDKMEGVVPILTTVPPASTLDRKDGPHENNAFVRAEAGLPQHMCWVTKRPDGGRGFSFTGGHAHKNWANDDFRKLVLNGIAWTAKVKIPKIGLVSPTPTATDLERNLDDKPCPIN